MWPLEHHFVVVLAIAQEVPAPEPLCVPLILLNCPCPWAYPNKSFHACDPAMCGCPCPRHPGGGIHGQWNPCACPCPRHPAPCPLHSTTAASSTRQSTTRQGGSKGTHDNQKSRARGPSAFRILHTDTGASEAFCQASTLRRLAMDRIRVRSPAYHRSCAARSSSRCCPLESNDLTTTRGEAIRCQQPQRGHEPAS